MFPYLGIIFSKIIDFNSVDWYNVTTETVTNLRGRHEGLLICGEANPFCFKLKK